MSINRMLRRLAAAVGIGLVVVLLGNFFLQPPQVRISESNAAAESAGDLEDRLTLSSMLLNDGGSTATWAEAIRKASGPEIHDFLEQWEQAGSPEARKALRTLAFKRWFLIEPQDAWEYARARALREKDEAWITEALAVWSEHDARAAVQTVSDSALPTRQRRAAEHAIISQFGTIDPERMLTLAREYGFGSIGPIFRQLARVDPELAAAKTLEMPSKSLLNDVLIAWASQGGCAEAFQWIQEHANESQKSDLYFLGILWATYDPEAAAANVDVLSRNLGPMKGSLLGKIAAEWSMRDPKAAQAWLDEIAPEGAEADTIQQHMISQLASSDPEAALVLYQDAVAAGFSPKLSVLPSKWKSRKPATVQAWVEVLPEGGYRNSALTQWWEHQFEQDPVAMLDQLPELLEQLTDETSDYTALANDVLNALSSRGQGEAEAWIDRLPKRHRAGFASRYANTLSNRNPEVALDFLTDQATQTGPTFQRIISNWARQDPAKAAERALAESDRELREMAISNVANVWKVTDPEAAKRLLESIE